MEDNNNVEGIIPISRRNVLKAGAVTAVGVGMFSGTAAATNADQINFCGCSQVCVERARNEDGTVVGGTFVVIVAKEDGEGGWEFGEFRFGGAGTDTAKKDFCFEPGDPYKIIAVRPAKETVAYCNPGRCARDALAAARETLKYVADGENEVGFDCQNDEGEGPEWGEFSVIGFDNADTEAPKVLIVHGQCGEPGRDPNPGPNPRGPNRPNRPNGPNGG